MNSAYKLIKLIEHLSIIFNQKTLYILGAGVSARYVPPRYDLWKLAKQYLIELGSILIQEGRQLSEEEENRFNIIGAYSNNDEWDFYDHLLHKNPDLVQIICAYTYSLDKFPLHCPEYEIFNFTHASSTILTMNHDNLVSFIRNKKIIPLHGEISPALKDELKKLLDDWPKVDIAKFLLKKLYLVTKENEHLLLHTQEYLDLMDILQKNKFDNVVIIGYSFFKKSPYDIYDVVTFDIINSYIINHKCKIFIIDKDPFFVADFLTKTSDIFIYTVNWASFVNALRVTNILKHSKYHGWNFDAIDLKRFVELYAYQNDTENYDYNLALASKILTRKSHEITIYRSDKLH